MGAAAPLVVVANPTAGRGAAGRRIGAVDSLLRSLRVDHEIRVAGSPRELEATCRSLGEGGAEIVAVLGGDGTASYAANGLLGTGAALAIVAFLMIHLRGGRPAAGADLPRASR